MNSPVKLKYMFLQDGPTLTFASFETHVTHIVLFFDFLFLLSVWIVKFLTFSFIAKSTNVVLKIFWSDQALHLKFKKKMQNQLEKLLY